MNPISWIQLIDEIDEIAEIIECGNAGNQTSENKPIHSPSDFNPQPFIQIN